MMSGGGAGAAALLGPDLDDNLGSKIFLLFLGSCVGVVFLIRWLM